MEIQGQLLHRKENTSERQANLREGDIYRAKIDSRTSHHEAVISIRGQAVKATFSGTLPENDRIMVKVEQQTRDGIRVTSIEGESRHNKLQTRSSENQIDRTLSRLDQRQITTELRQATQQFLDRDVFLTRESVRELNRFLHHGKGTLDQRLDTVQALANKGVEPTTANLQAVHEALHGKSLENHIRQISQSDVKESIREILQSDVKSAGRQWNKLNLPQNNGQNKFHSNTPANQSRFSAWQQTIANEANLQLAIEKIRSEVSNQGLPQDILQQLHQGLEQAYDFLQKGRELKARQELTQIILAAQRNMPQSTAPVTTGEQLPQEVLQYITNQIMQSGNVPSKDILITEVTERLAKATDEFKAFQRDVTNQLSRIQILIQQLKSQGVQQTKPMLETVIRQLDQALLKNNWLLFTDMKTEKNVLEASSMLAKAKKHLTQGQHEQARQIIREVQQTIDKLMYKPTNQRVQHFISREVSWLESKAPAHRLTQEFDNTARTLTHNDGSGRQVLEGFRSLGINREPELAQLLANGKGHEAVDQQRNVRTVLLQMLRGEEDSGRQQQLQQALQNLSGQQLMAKIDHQQNMQMLMLQLPILIKGQAENLQVFVNSRNDGEKLDWENCSLYFLMETKKMGEVGILVKVSERALNITLKNDDPTFQSKMEPIAHKYVDKLKDIGFQFQGLHFAPITEEQGSHEVSKQENGHKELKPTMTKKGFDYKI
ncbi:putative RNA-binding protein with TRAM domain [Evansella vedderi]|uniref:RNA-binding protein with TRAM domain n=1 Tax=Evansella vedderi TaxID=38282 RepID=A0ABT9ZZS3_9BACI|nr:hypothetical protein [Evansella vedderi]MDQ0256211.1 putative RNA-binding protein with TRAM domain [Evansella vedderi]